MMRYDCILAERPGDDELLIITTVGTGIRAKAGFPFTVRELGKETDPEMVVMKSLQCANTSRTGGITAGIPRRSSPELAHTQANDGCLGSKNWKPSRDIRTIDIPVTFSGRTAGFYTRLRIQIISSNLARKGIPFGRTLRLLELAVGFNVLK